MVRCTVKVGQVIQVGDATIRIDHKSGQNVAVVIDAPEHIKITKPKKDTATKVA